MRKTWVSAIAVVAILVVALVWVRSARQEKVPEPSVASAYVASTAVPAKKLARQKHEACTPLAGGGFSCGACRDNSDCPEKSACIINLATGRTECQASDCNKNQQCEKGTSCRVVARSASGAAVQACVAPGKRPAGAACEPDNGGDPTVSCAGNLVCINGGCAPQCQPGPNPTDSEECGYLGCYDSDNGYGCTPSCKQGQPCGGGKTCSFLSTESPISLCTHAVGKNCLGPDGGCTATQDCLVETNAREERTTFRCVERCTLENADKVCPEVSICVLSGPSNQRGHCRRRCSREGDTACGSGERCKREDAGDDWFCSAT